MKVHLPNPVWVFAAAKIALHLATTRLSFHRDELYFITASKHLTASFVDFQPITPLLVRLERTVFGDSLFGMRLIPALAGASMIVLAALIARELGGDRRAQILAGLSLLIVPLFIGMDTAVNTVSLETPAFMLIALAFARLLRTRDPRWWVALGAASGLALLVKFTVLAYLAGIAIAVLASPLRRDIRSKWFWLGALVTTAMVAPSIVWQAKHDFPVVEFVGNQGGGGAVLGLRGRLGYLASLLILPGIVAVFLYVPGLISLLRDKTFRPLGVTHAIALAGFFVASGKGYYAAPAIAVLCCAGAVASIRVHDRYPRGLLIGIAVSLLVSSPLVLPLVPVSVLASNSDISDATELGERLGWDDIARDTSKIYQALPSRERSRTIVIGENYTLPSAIEFYAEDYDLPRVAVSGHNSAYLWWPDIPDDHVAISLGFGRTELEALYDDVERVGTIRNSDGVDNYEWGKPIHVARGPKVSPAELRKAIKTFEA